MSRLVMVTGYLRSGTTILSQLLGSCSGVFTIGELHNSWYAWASNSLCSCHQPIRDCEVWSWVLRAAVPDLDRGKALELHNLGRSIVRNRNYPTLVRDRSRGTSRNSDLAKYVEAIDGVIDGLVERTACDVLIDTSKSSSAVLLTSLLRVDQVDLIHLIRDVRAVAWSQANRKHIEVPTDVRPPQVGYVQSAVEWLGINYGIALSRRYCGDYVRMSYEQLCHRPRETCELLCRQLDLPGASLRWETDARTIQLASQHMIAGNPNRLAPRRRTISLDDSWESGMGPGQKAGLGGVRKLGDVLFPATFPRGVSQTLESRSEVLVQNRRI